LGPHSARLEARKAGRAAGGDTRLTASPLAPERARGLCFSPVRLGARAPVKVEIVDTWG